MGVIIDIVIDHVYICLFQKQIIPFLQSVFLPVVTKIFQVLNTPVDERDQDAASDKRLLQRSYFSFIATLVNNNVQEVLSNQGKILLHLLFFWKLCIECLVFLKERKLSKYSMIFVAESNNLQQVLLTIIQGAVDLPDPTGQKICFSILKKLIEFWGKLVRGSFFACRLFKLGKFGPVGWPFLYRMWHFCFFGYFDNLFISDEDVCNLKILTKINVWSWGHFQ